MEVQFYQTRNALLKPFLEGYYVLSKADGSEDVEYLTFPNNLINVSAYQHAQVSLEANLAVISEDKNHAFNSVLVSGYKTPIKVSYQGKINEVTFCFKPLGLHSFVPDFYKYLKHQLNSFVPFGDYKDFISSVLSESVSEQRIYKIETYWLSKLIDFQHQLLFDLVLDISLDEEINIGDLALKHHTSRQNINKLFNRYLGKSPAYFRKVHRFRLALNKRIAVLKQDKNLTTLSYEALFYDQSHMVKEFRMLTGYTPKLFFEKIALKKGAGSWLFEK